MNNFKVSDGNYLFGYFATLDQTNDKAENIHLSTGQKPTVYESIECFTCKGMGGDCCGKAGGRDWIEVDNDIH